MVCNWSPEPSRVIDDHLVMPIQGVVNESDESEDEMFGNAPPGYELLSQGPSQGISSDEEDLSDTETMTNSPGSSSPQSDIPSTSDNQGAGCLSEVQEVDRLFSASALRPQMTVDCDQVKAAMAGFSLPPSAYPAWAVNVPESQWAAAVAQHLQRIQSDKSGS